MICAEQNIQWCKNVLISYRAVIAVAVVTTRRLLSGIQPNSYKKNLVLKQSSSSTYFIARFLVLINVIYIIFVVS